jgi:hypothetical protein
MRKIEKEVIGAFVNGDTKAIANTESAINPTTRDLDLLLHGNRIATMSNRDGVKKLWVSNAGWPTRTTQSRLNALFRLLDMPEHVYTKNHVQYLDSTRHGTFELTKLQKSAVLVYQWESRSASAWQDRLRRLLDTADDHSEYLPRSEQTIH